MTQLYSLLFKKNQLLFLFFSLIFINGQTVSTLAGDGNYGNKDGVGTAASFNNIYQIALDASGNIYVADFGNHKIRKVTPAGVVTTFAGIGFAGSADGSVSSATFKWPRGVAVDASGNVYVSDTGNQKIRKISTTGIVSTIAGNGTVGKTDGVGSSASFNYPEGLVVDASGNIYVADTNNSVIRKITPTGTVSTYAGDGTAGSVNGSSITARFNYPQGVTVDASGNVYVADTRNNMIRKITPAGVVSTFAGDITAGDVNGVGVNAKFNSPVGLSADVNSNLYVADTSNNKIKKITSAAEVSTFAGVDSWGYVDGDISVASFSDPYSIVYDAQLDKVYVSDNANGRIRAISPKANNLALDNTARKEIMTVYYDTKISKIKLFSKDMKVVDYRIFDFSGKLLQYGIEKTNEISFVAKAGIYLLIINEQGKNNTYRFRIP